VYRKLLFGLVVLSLLTGCLGSDTLDESGTSPSVGEETGNSPTTSLECPNGLYTDRIFDVTTNDSNGTTIYEYELSGRNETATEERVLEYSNLGENKQNEFDGAVEPRSEETSSEYVHYWNNEVNLVSKNGEYYAVYATVC
jgi:hypothetical protein